MKNSVKIYLKGMLMGICDIIPGISGGTIAFITGIYARLINAVKSFSPSLILDLFQYPKNKGKLIESIKKLDLIFLITLVAGIGTAFLIMSRVISFLLDRYFAFTISFFIGLILASSTVIYKKIENHKPKNILFGFVGFGAGILLSVLSPVSIVPGLFYVFIGGFLAISAMFLPGISGAFILLVLGIYEFMLKVLYDPFSNFYYLLVFILGAGLGAFTISRIISFLFRKDRCKTLYVLLGLVVGSLSIPLRRIYETAASFEAYNIALMVVFLLLGAFIVYFITHLEKDVDQT
jgi:putative membrane protein|tara:strand:- start:10366 stop:11241 length:876 start_codon:yes stop_codon:yes gene_type:complete